MTVKRKNPYIGSSLESLLKETGDYDTCNTLAIKEVLAWQLQQIMKEQGLSKQEMAKRMDTSRAALDRLLDPENTAVTLNTMIKAAATVGKNIRIEFF